MIHGTHSENGSCFILKWILKCDTCLYYVKGHSNFHWVVVLIVYNVFIPGPPGPAVPPPAGYAGGLPMGYNSPQQPSTFFPYRPAGGAHPIRYQPGKYHMPTQPVPVSWMPGPPPAPDCPPGLEYLTQVVLPSPDDFLMKCARGSGKKRHKAR